MITPIRTLALTALTLMLTACGGGSSGQAGNTVIQLDTDGKAVATVNGVDIPQSLLDAQSQVMGLDPTVPAQRQQVLNELVQSVLLAQQADRLKVAQQPDLAAHAEVARLQGVASATLQAYNRAHPITDEMLAEDYARQAEEAGSVTYRFTQLLFKDRADADAAAGELGAGMPFKDVYDKWHGKALDAQQYGGVFPRQLPDPLGAALVDLDPGQTTPRPLQSNLGWHLLHLDGTDPFHAPPLEQVKDQVRRGMQDKQAQAWMESLRSTAKIVIDSPVRELPAAAASSARALSRGEAGRSGVVAHDGEEPSPAGDGSSD